MCPRIVLGNGEDTPIPSYGNTIILLMIFSESFANSMFNFHRGCILESKSSWLILSTFLSQIFCQKTSDVYLREPEKNTVANNIHEMI